MNEQISPENNNESIKARLEKSVGNAIVINCYTSNVNDLQNIYEPQIYGVMNKWNNLYFDYVLTGIKSDELTQYEQWLEPSIVWVDSISEFRTLIKESLRIGTQSIARAFNIASAATEKGLDEHTSNVLEHENSHSNISESLGMLPKLGIILFRDFSDVLIPAPFVFTTLQLGQTPQDYLEKRIQIASAPETYNTQIPLSEGDIHNINLCKKFLGELEKTAIK